MSDLRNYLHDGDPAASVDDTRVDAGWERLSRELPTAGATPLKRPGIRRSVRRGLIAAAASVALVAGSVGTYHFLTRDVVDITLPADTPTTTTPSTESPEVESLPTPKNTPIATPITVLGNRINVVETPVPTTGVVEYLSAWPAYAGRSTDEDTTKPAEPVHIQYNSVFVPASGQVYEVTWKRNYHEEKFPMTGAEATVLWIQRHASVDDLIDEYAPTAENWADLSKSANPLEHATLNRETHKADSLMREVQRALWSTPPVLSGQGRADAIAALGKIPGVEATSTVIRGRSSVVFSKQETESPEHRITFTVDSATGQLVTDSKGTRSGLAISHDAIPDTIVRQYDQAMREGKCESLGDETSEGPLRCTITPLKPE